MYWQDPSTVRDCIMPSPSRLTLLLAVWLLAAPALPARAQPARAPDDDGFAVTPPRLEADVEIDGALDEPAWQQAARLDGFSQYLPADGRPAQHATEVLVWYSPSAIHFGIRCHAPPGAVRATLADRDKIGGDDYVQLLLDTFNDQRQAFVIGVNPLGVQADGILRDAARNAGMLSSDANAYTIDLSPDFVFKSKGRLTDFGYEVEVQVPFKSLRYQAAEAQTWGFNVIRKVQQSGYENTWTPVMQANASFLAQSGTLGGLSDLRRGLVLDVTPEVTSTLTGADAEDGWTYGGGTPQAGGNVRWGLTNNLTLNGTVNPDFSQVEADVAQIQYDPRRALFFPEKRPFFLEGIELFEMPNQLIYTRRVADPAAAVKLAGKVQGTTLALLSALDARATSATGDDPRFFNLLRLRRDLGGQSTLGAAYTDKIDGDDYNRVAALDGRLVLAQTYAVTFQGAASFTRRGGRRTSAPLWHLAVNRAGRGFGFNYVMRGIHPDFRAESGFFSRVGIVTATFAPRITRFGRPGGTLESWTGSITFDGTWDYDRFTAGKIPNDAKLHLNNSFNLKGGWVVGGSLLIESFKYPPELYTNYFIERTENGAVVDTVAFTGTDRLSNLDVVLTARTPRFQQFSGNVFVIYGRDENFFEWAPADIFFITLSADWRPTEQLRVNLLYNHQQYIRPDDRSNVGLRRVPRLKVEYQLTRAIFVRLVGQYDANFVDALRDHSRTDDPILIFDAATGTYARAQPVRRNDFRVDWLFSYRPTPGTVFFLGYGSSLDEPDAFRFRRLSRTSDGFFLKLSYLIRA